MTIITWFRQLFCRHYWLTAWSGKKNRQIGHTCPKCGKRRWWDQP